jgi:hypothetical protein
MFGVNFPAGSKRSQHPFPTCADHTRLAIPAQARVRAKFDPRSLSRNRFVTQLDYGRLLRRCIIWKERAEIAEGRISHTGSFTHPGRLGRRVTSHARLSDWINDDHHPSHRPHRQGCEYCGKSQFEVRRLQLSCYVAYHADIFANSQPNKMKNHVIRMCLIAGS